MDMKDVESYRRQAAVCREEANKASGPISAAGWLQLADDFDELATNAQRLSRPPSLWIDSVRSFSKRPVRPTR
jgi:hypothetical protein